MKKILFAGALLAALGSYAAADEHIKVYHGESCGCCHNWAKYMEQNGFEVEMISLADEPLIQKKNELGLPLELASCRDHRRICSRRTYASRRSPHATKK